MHTTTKRSLGITILFCASCLVSQSATAQDSAVALYDLLKIQSTVAPAIEQYADTLSLTATQRAEIYTRYRSGVAAQMSNIYTRKEIAALTSFYASDIGQSVISKQAEIGGKYADVLLAVLSEYRAANDTP